MKRTGVFYILFVSCFVGPLTAQTIVSSCTTPDTAVFHMYASDAQHLAERRVYADSSSYTDSAFIPSLWTDTSLNALIAVYNGTGLAARDSVVNLFPVHADVSNPVLNQIVVYADSTLPWMEQFNAGHAHTGIAQVDSIMNDYGFRIIEYYNSVDVGVVVLQADTNYNMLAVAARFSHITGVTSSLPFAFPTTGGRPSDISDSVTAEFIQLTYLFAYPFNTGDEGDLTHYWTFRVYPDCSVQFTGSGGDSLDVPSLGVADIAVLPSVSVYPNPAQEQAFIQTNHSNGITITNLLGQRVWQSEASKQNEFAVQIEQPGADLITVRNQSASITQKLIVTGR